MLNIFYIYFRQIRSSVKLWGFEKFYLYILPLQKLVNVIILKWNGLFEQNLKFVYKISYFNKTTIKKRNFNLKQTPFLCEELKTKISTKQFFCLLGNFRNNHEIP